MRVSSFVRNIALASVLAGALSMAGRAAAEDEFDVKVAGGKVTVVTKGGWHINEKYPWKLVVGDKKLGKDKFELSKSAASVAAPKGTGKLKGGVCRQDQCRMFKKTVTIR